MDDSDVIALEIKDVTWHEAIKMVESPPKKFRPYSLIVVNLYLIFTILKKLFVLYE